MNKISALVDEQGRTMKDEAKITQVALDYFTTLFTTQPIVNDELQDLVEQRPISDQIYQRVSRVYTEEELVDALSEMHPSKAPGPDGLPAGFYQKFWPQIKREVIDYCLNVLNNGATVQAVNHIGITLIPKVKKLKSMKQFRPISLCNTIYKIISKTVAIRLRDALPQVISEEQSAFVKGRLIADKIMVAYELLHKLRGKRSETWLLRFKIGYVQGL